MTKDALSALAVAGTLVAICITVGAGCGGGGGGSAPDATEAGIPSVCGGVVTSSPKICSPSLVRDPSGSLAVRFGLSDLEGDLTQFCYGVGPPGSDPPCNNFLLGAPLGEMVNNFVTLELPFTEGLTSGTTTAFSLEATDSASHGDSLLAELEVP